MKKILISILACLMFIPGVFLLASCCGADPWCDVSVAEDLPESVESVTVGGATTDENGEMRYGGTKGSEISIFVYMKPGYALGTIKVKANGEEIEKTSESINDLKYYYVFTIKKLKGETEITLSGEGELYNVDFSFITDEQTQEEIEAFNKYRFNIYIEEPYIPIKSNINYSQLVALTDKTKADTISRKYPLGTNLVVEMWDSTANVIFGRASDYDFGESVSDEHPSLSFKVVGGRLHTLQTVRVVEGATLNVTKYSGDTTADFGEANNIGLCEDSSGIKLDVYSGDTKITTFDQLVKAQDITLKGHVTLKDVGFQDILENIDSSNPQLKIIYYLINAEKADMPDVTINRTPNEIIISNVKKPWEYYKGCYYYDLMFDNIDDYVSKSDNWFLLEEDSNQLNQYLLTAVEGGLIDGSDYEINRESAYSTYRATEDGNIYGAKDGEFTFRIVGNYLVDKVKITIDETEFIFNNQTKQFENLPENIVKTQVSKKNDTTTALYVTLKLSAFSGITITQA